MVVEDGVVLVEEEEGEEIEGRRQEAHDKVAS